jgi:flagellar FliL protein
MTDDRDEKARATDGDVAPATAKRSRKKLVAVVLAIVLVGVGAKLFLLTPKSGAGTCPTATTTAPPGATTTTPPASSAGATATPCPPELGPVLKLDPVMINLADGRYLQLGLALQLSAGTDLKLMTDDSGGGARALDAAVALFGSKTYNELVSPTGLEPAKQALERTIVAAYDGKVLGIYFTSFVMQ